MKKTVQVKESLINIVKVVAEAQDMTIGQFVENAITEKLEKLNPPKNGNAILKSGKIELHITTK